MEIEITFKTSFLLIFHFLIMEFERPVLLEPYTQMICYPPPPRKHLSPTAPKKAFYQYEDEDFSDSETQPSQLDVNIDFTRKSMATSDIMDELMRRQNQKGSPSSTITRGRFMFTTATRIPSEPSSLPSRY